jgi:hypothetical protein
MKDEIKLPCTHSAFRLSPSNVPLGSRHLPGAPADDSSRAKGQKSEKWHLSRDEFTDSSRRSDQKSTKMGCVRDARDEFTDSSRAKGQKSGK